MKSPAGCDGSRALVVAAFLGVGVCALGCQSLQGAPPPSYDVDLDLEQLRSHFEPAKAISTFYENRNATEADRNKVVVARLVMINLQYLKWIRTMAADRQLADTAAEVLVLTLNLAATATGGAGVKTVLSAVSAGITGSQTSINKNYFYEKTLPPLIATMNAQRKEVLAQILGKMQLSLGQYPFEQAITDVDVYYQAGTFLGATLTIEREAGDKEKRADQQIKALALPTAAERISAATLDLVWSELFKKADAVPHANILRKALVGLGATVAPGESDVAVRLRLLRLSQLDEKSSDEILKALRDAGYPGLSGP